MNETEIDGLMEGNSSDLQATTNLLARIAYMYYIDGETQEIIGRRLGLSRQKVQRLLGQARDLGIVEIRIHPSMTDVLDLASELKSRFHLQEVLVTPAYPNYLSQRKLVAQEAARFLNLYLKNGMVVAVGMGRNTGEIPNVIDSKRQINCTFVPAMGGSPNVEFNVNPNEICRSLAVKFGGKAEMLYAPAFVESAEMRNLLVQQEVIQRTMELAAQADCALVGIGGTDDTCTLVRSGCFSVRQIRQMRKNMAVGDLLGNYFDIYGSMIHSDFYGRLIGLTLEDLKRIKNVICVVCESNKAASILGALRTGIVEILILDAKNAREVLNLDETYPLPLEKAYV